MIPFVLLSVRYRNLVLLSFARYMIYFIMLFLRIFETARFAFQKTWDYHSFSHPEFRIWFAQYWSFQNRISFLSRKYLRLVEKAFQDFFQKLEWFNLKSWFKNHFSLMFLIIIWSDFLFKTWNFFLGKSRLIFIKLNFLNVWNSVDPDYLKI